MCSLLSFLSQQVSQEISSEGQISMEEGELSVEDLMNKLKNIWSWSSRTFDHEAKCCTALMDPFPTFEGEED